MMYIPRREPPHMATRQLISPGTTPHASYGDSSRQPCHAGLPRELRVCASKG